MDNIAFFNRMTLALFDNLYSAFPTPVDLKTNDIAMSVIPEGAEYDETWKSRSDGQPVARADLRRQGAACGSSARTLGVTNVSLRVVRHCRSMRHAHGGGNGSLHSVCR